MSVHCVQCMGPACLSACRHGLVAKRIIHDLSESSCLFRSQLLSYLVFHLFRKSTVEIIFFPLQKSAVEFIFFSLQKPAVEFIFFSLQKQRLSLYYFPFRNQQMSLCSCIFTVIELSSFSFRSQKLSSAPFIRIYCKLISSLFFLKRYLFFSFQKSAVKFSIPL